MPPPAGDEQQQRAPIRIALSDNGREVTLGLGPAQQGANFQRTRQARAQPDLAVRG